MVLQDKQRFSKENGLGQLEKTNWLFFFMFHLPHCHNMCHQETGSIAFGTHTHRGTSVRPGWFSKLSLLWGLYQSKQPPWEKGPMLWCSGHSFLFSILACQSKVLGESNSPCKYTFFTHRTPKTKTAFQLLWLFPTLYRESQQQAPRTCSSTSKYVSGTLSGTGFLM